jgi:NAD(P)-dependent dehydrogenase (short-subunit alcohol dehydrogenase family)
VTARRIVVTGAFGILGAAVAKAAAAGGDRIALLDFAPEPPDGLVADCGPGAFVLSGVDLTDPASAHLAVNTAASALGGIDALLNIAGGFSWQTLADGDAETWERLYRLNVATAANACRAALPHLRGSQSGRIVNVGANAALRSGAGMGAYAASKAGVHRLTESLAEELKADGITVNAVLPSILDTPANRADMPKADPALWVSPAELSAVILFLASEAASAVTGALVPVTGRV